MAMASIFRHKTDFKRLSKSELDAWAELPTSILTDVMHRMQTLDGAYNPVLPKSRLAGQAKTVLAMVADSSVVHAAVSVIEEGDVLMLNAGGYVDRACWGGLATRAAMRRGARGLVINGAIRDTDEIRESGFPVYCLGSVPSGPHKGHGGTIDGVLAMGNVAIHPGDIVVGDDDGVVVVPLHLADKVRRDAAALIGKEAEWQELIESGGSMAEMLGISITDID